MEQVTFCRACGGAIALAAKWCEHCGARRGSEAAEVPAPTQLTQEHHVGVGTGFNVGCGVVLGMAAGAALLLMLLLATCTRMR